VLAQKLDVKKCHPGGRPARSESRRQCSQLDLFSFPPRNVEMHAWQWEKRLSPTAKSWAKLRRTMACTFCFELHRDDMGYNPETLLPHNDPLRQFEIKIYVACFPSVCCEVISSTGKERGP
jgi:hypothetical protein